MRSGLCESITVAISDVVDLLACPHCRAPLGVVEDARSVRCEQGHSFDVARQGYLNLAGGTAGHNADTPTMVAARDRFLSAGPYRPVVDRLLELARTAAPASPRLLEVGAGTGYYLARLVAGLDASRGVALDVSPAAARRAARAGPRIGSVVADAWRTIPVATGAIDLLLDVFAPRNAAEFARVLSGRGVLLTVTPHRGHLAEIRDPLGLLQVAPGKQRQLQATLAGTLRQTYGESLSFAVELDDSLLHDVVAMGPSAFHLSEEELSARVGAVTTPVSVTVAVELGLWVVTPP